jgi:hypothetical protein
VSPMKSLNVQRLTRNRDAVRATEKKLPDALRDVFQQTLRPDLITILQQTLQPLNSTILENQQNQALLANKFTNHHEDLTAIIRELKEDIKSSHMTQKRIESCLASQIVVPEVRQITQGITSNSVLDTRETSQAAQSSGVEGTKTAQKLAREFLSEM